MKGGGECCRQILHRRHGNCDVGGVSGAVGGGGGLVAIRASIAPLSGRNCWESSVPSNNVAMSK